jgi:hypothetical protein
MYHVERLEEFFLRVVGDSGQFEGAVELLFESI